MNDPQHTLTAELQQTICAYIRAGAFPQIAAEAAGIPQKVFERWMRFGQAARPVPLYRDFVLAVRQAQAQARLVAENHALKQAPLTWLKSGPGKETARMPGWTSPVKPPTPARKGSGLSSQRMMEFMSCLLTALEPFPEARLAAADMLEKGGWMNDPDPIPHEENPQPAAVDPQPIASAALPPTAELPEEPIAVGSSSPDTGRVESNNSPSPAPQCPETNPQANEKPSNPNRNEPATNTQRTDNEQTSKQPPCSTPAPRNRPGAWDSLDSRHWIVFSSG